MKKILLISNYVFHYRINIYNYFYDEFKKLGYNFSVLTNEAQKADFETKFELIIKRPSIISYIMFIRKINPDFVITFLHLKNIRIFPITYFCKINKIPIIYWNFGINTKTPNALFKNLFYKNLHNISDAILLYSPLEKKFIKAVNHHKVFIAYNTLNFSNVKFRKYEEDLKYVREKYNIKERDILLFVGRITENKKIDLLLNILKNKPVAVVIVGKGLDNRQKKIIENTPNYYHLGEIYNPPEINAIFNSSKLFCIPGNIGLALNQAFYWGKPVITLEGRNTPEIYYLENNKNGFSVKNEAEIEQKTMYLINNPSIYKEFSNYAKKTADNKAHIRNMFNGFLKAIQYIDKNRPVLN